MKISKFRKVGSWKSVVSWEVDSCDELRSTEPFGGSNKGRVIMCSGRCVSVHITSFFSVSSASMSTRKTVCRLNNKATISLYKILDILMLSMCYKKLLLIVDREFFLSLSCWHQRNLVPRTTPTVKKVSDGLCHSLSPYLLNTTWAQRELINKLLGNACYSYVTKATVVPHLMPLPAIVSYLAQWHAHYIIKCRTKPLQLLLAHSCLQSG